MNIVILIWNLTLLINHHGSSQDNRVHNSSLSGIVAPYPLK